MKRFFSLICLVAALGGCTPLTLPLSDSHCVPATEFSRSPATQESQPEQPATAPAQTQPSLGLASLQPLAYSLTTVQQLAAQYQQFKHVPYDQSGVNPLVLPFRDESSGGASDESLALSFLLGFDLDWMPTNFSTRHTYFIFKRSQEICRSLTHRYDTRKVAKLMEDWQSTHAIGGSIRKHETGYTGSLVVYGTGAVALKLQTFDTPRPYHQLLGDISAAAMAIMGDPPSQKVADYLHQPRCTDPSSLQLLGRAAFVKERTREEFDLYGKILEQDPHFTEVCYWYYNQSKWQKIIPVISQESLIDSMNIRMIPLGLSAFTITSQTAPKLKTDYQKLLDKADDLIGRDSESVLAGRLRMTYDSSAAQIDPDLIQRAMAYLSANPNQGTVGNELAIIMSTLRGGYDAELSISIALCVMGSHFTPANGWDRQARLAARQMILLGQPIQALQVLQFARNGDLVNIQIFVRALTQAGYFKQALELDCGKPGDYNDIIQAIFSQAIAASALHNPEAFDNLLRRYQENYRKHDIFEALESLCNELKTSSRTLPEAPPWYSLKIEDMEPVMTLVMNYDLENYQGAQRWNTARWASGYMPTNRLVWALMDQYMQSGYGLDASGLYGMLELMYPDDPWACATVQKWKHRGYSTSISEGWEDYPPLRDMPASEIPFLFDPSIDCSHIIKSVHPWSIAARVHTLLKDGKRQEALALARKYRQATLQIKKTSFLAFSHLMVRRAEEWKPRN